jgi:glycosyltransferase involved in cell wall biosynthesis
MVETEQFFVSVIIPVYNGEAFLAEAVASIQRQAYQPLEIIIIDDGSTDNTAQIARSFAGNVRYVFQSNRGPAAARNRGLRMARGNVIGFLDADDLWPDNRLNPQLAYLAAHPQTEVIQGHIQYIRAAENMENGFEFEKFAKPFTALSVVSALFRRSVFDEVGFFDEALLCSEDVDWFIRAKECGVSVVTGQQVTQLHRRHTRNMTNQRKLIEHYTLRALKKSLDRRRERDEPLS